MSNYSVEFNSNILALDTTVSPNVYAVNRLRDALFGATDVLYNGFFQVSATPATVPFPGTFRTAQVVWVCNLGTAGDISVTFTPTGGGPQSLFLSRAPSSGQLGGAFLYINPSVLVGGIAAVSLSSTAASSAEVLVASGGTVGAAGPTITNLTPNSGAAGSQITITGAGFGATQGSSSVQFNGTTATVSSWSDGAITVTVPSGLSADNVLVTVTTPTGTSNGVPFTMGGGTVPTISIGTVTTLPPIDSMTLATAYVQVDPASTNQNVILNYGIPAGLPGAGGGGAISSGFDVQGFYFDDYVTPDSPANLSTGQGTTQVIPNPKVDTLSCTYNLVFNSNLSNNSITASIYRTTGNIPAAGAPVGASDTLVVALYPTQVTAGVLTAIGGAIYDQGVTAGTGYRYYLALTGTEGTIELEDSSYLQVAQIANYFAPAPTISGVNPSSAQVGTVITITGTNFGGTQGSSTVSFGGITATPTSWSDTGIIVAVPAGAHTGELVVTVGGQSASTSFSVTAPPAIPAISSLTPSSGTVPVSVTIAGSNFGASQGTSTVTLGGAPLGVTSWSAGSIVVSVPSGAVTGNIVVTVGGNASAGALFTVTTPAASQLILNTGTITFPNSATRNLASICGGITIPAPSGYAGQAGITLFCQTAWYPAISLTEGQTVTISGTGVYDGTHTVAGLSTAPDPFGMTLLAA